MTDPYLIAHKVRGEPAFDVAIQMVCPLCPNESHGCHECDGLGYWWIVPTSGHRAYPWLFNKLSDFENPDGYSANDWSEMPEPWPDYYPDATTPKVDLIQALGLKPRPQKIERRI